MLELYLRNLNTGLWLSESDEHRMIAFTLAVALRDVVADHLGIISTEMGVSTRLDRDTVTGQARSVIQLFDQASGGAGFVLAALEEIPKFLKQMVGKLTCPANCDSVCSHCLAGQDSQIERHELDRRAALTWIEASGLLQSLSLPEVFAEIPAIQYSAIGAKQWVNTQIQRGATGITVFLQGDADEWQVDATEFRNQLLNWSTQQNLKVTVVIPIAANLSNEITIALRPLSDLGIVFCTPSATQRAYDQLAIQMRLPDKTLSLFGDQLSCLQPSPYWLEPDQQCVWASTTALEAASLSPIQTQAWQNQPQLAGTTIIEIIDQMDGRLTDLTTHLQALLEQHCPNFAELIQHDVAVRIEYTDRYLKSPWCSMLLTAVLSMFKNSELQQVDIKTLKFTTNDRPSRKLDHDWPDSAQFQQMISRWIDDDLNLKPNVHLSERAADLPHGRSLLITWKSGKTTTVLFDQGMGYWRPSGSQHDVGFNFTQPPEIQLEQMIQVFSRLTVQHGSPWPTYLVINHT